MEFASVEKEPNNIVYIRTKLPLLNKKFNSPPGFIVAFTCLFVRVKAHCAFAAAWSAGFGNAPGTHEYPPV